MSDENAANNIENSSERPWLKDHQWKPGQSGNPNGRPKKKLVDEALTELLEANNSVEAIELAKKLLELAKAGDVRASQLVTERTQGKPQQKVEVSGPEGGPIDTRIEIVLVKATDVTS